MGIAAVDTRVSRRRELARALVAEAFTRAWAPRPKALIDRWADENYVLLEKMSARPGQYSTAITPYVRCILRAYVDPVIETVTVMKSSQLGFTELLLVLILYTIANEPAPMLAVYPNDILAAFTGRDRLTPAIKACRATKDKLADSIADQGSLRVSLEGMTVYLTGSGNETNLRSRPVAIRLVDEVDLCKEGVCEELDQRGDTFRGLGGKQYEVGTPSHAGTGVDARYAISDKRRFDVPCPHCGSFQELVWERVEWCEGGQPVGVDPDEAGHSAWVRCIRSRCRGKKIENSHKRAMLEAGIWIRDGLRIRQIEEVREEERGTARVGLKADAALGLGQVCPKGYAVVGTSRASTHAGFRINSLYSPFVTFGDVAKPFVKAKGSPPLEWWNGRLGRAWRPKSDRVEVRELEKLCVPVARGGYLHGTCPADVLCLTGQVDVQRDSLWIEIQGWTPHARDLCLIWYGQVACPFGRGLSVLDGILDKVYPCGDGYGRRARNWAIDSGYGERTEEVYDYCRSRCRPQGHARGFMQVVPVKGDGSMTTVLPFRESAIWKGSDGKALPGLPWLFSINTLIWKSAMFGRLRLALDRAEGKDLETMVGVGADRGGARLPADCPMAYLMQLTAEELVEERARGVLVARYKLRSGRTDNHAIDTRYYGEARASQLKIAELGPGDVGRFQVVMDGSGAKATPNAAVAPSGGGGTRIRVAQSLVRDD